MTTIDNLNISFAHVEQNLPFASFCSVGGVGVSWTPASYFSDETCILFRANSIQVLPENITRHSTYLIKYCEPEKRFRLVRRSVKGFSMANLTTQEENF